jgi:ATP adenylyltransferase
VKLWDRILEVSRRALECGALEPITTDRVVVEEHGIPFLIHSFARLQAKATATTEQRATDTNPFLPPDPELIVADVSETHIAVLNRFNVLAHHLLIVTRRFVDQRELLDLADFEALGSCMAEMNGLGFYNAGKVAGASQPHKHLQLVPLPLGTGPQLTPLDSVLSPAIQPGLIHRVEAFRFPHAIVRLDGSPLSDRRAPELLATYHQLLGAVEIIDGSIPYNLIVCTKWMLVVPRQREHVASISINALGFVGSLLVRNRRELELVRKRGPLELLRSVAGSMGNRNG